MAIPASMLAVLGLAASAHAKGGWVGGGFFGINFQQLRELGPSQRTKHLNRIKALGIRDMRVGFAWPRIEPLAPLSGRHSYRWDSFDGEIAALARHGITPQANITQTPRWNADSSIIGALNCNQSSSFAPADIRQYGPLVKAIAARYGRGGTFWRAHRDIPARPIVRYEIWNEPNLRGGWCPNPQPERYADMFMIATKAIRSVDPHAQVVVGGLAPPAKENRHYLSIAHFLGRATGRQPNMRRAASGAAVHIYPATSARKQLDRVAWFRSQLRKGGIPNRVPMLINEIGWPAGGGSKTITESERAKAYRRATVNIPRTNCNVMGMLPQAWTSRQRDPSNVEDWYGIANPVTAKPYPSALAYSHGLRLMRGDLRQAPPGRPLMVCPGMPRPPAPGDTGGGDSGGVDSGGGDSAQPGRCTISGTPGADRLPGTPEPDAICALGGRDFINGKRGADVLLGGRGRDRIVSGRGNDRLKGGRKRDLLKGGTGRDRLSGGPGRDVLKGGPGRDALIGGPGRDACYGHRGHDRFKSCERVVRTTG